MSVNGSIVNTVSGLNKYMSLDFLQEKGMYVLFKALSILFIVIIMLLAIRIGNIIITKFVEKQDKLKYSLHIRKAKTLGAVLKSILKYFVYFFGVVAIFTQLELFGTISLTFAGIGGVALGFGAQSVVKDVIAGFFILFEDHFTVGDYIEIEGKSGVVESLELRITRLIGLNGDVHIIPNGTITAVTNHSRGALAMTIALDIPYAEDMDKTLEIINKVCDKFKEENSDVIEGPSVWGITDLKENFYTIKLGGKAKPMTQWANENKLRMEIKRALDDAGIRLAYSKTEFVKGEQNGQEL